MDNPYKALNFVSSIYSALLVLLLATSVSSFFKLNDDNRDIDYLKEHTDKVRFLQSLDDYFYTFSQSGSYDVGIPYRQTDVMVKLNDHIDLLKRFIRESDLSSDVKKT